MISSRDHNRIRHYTPAQRRAAARAATTRPAKDSRSARAQSGQSLIIAIAVLFLLAFLAALFIALLSRNLERTNRASQVLTADFYAQAGIHYADQMLTTSPQGADWRPAMRYYLGDNYAQLNPDPNTTTVTAPQTFSYTVTPTLNPAEKAGYLAYVNASLASNSTIPPLNKINPNDPDKFWLEQGFTRYPAQGGRYLIRLTYGVTGAVTNNPYEQDNPATGKYIRIESVGRTGVVDDTNPADPTVFSAQPTRLNATLVAYKPIGLTDYARFITNRDQRSDTFALGVPSRYFDPATQSVGTPASTQEPSIVTPGVTDFTTNGNGYDLDQYPLVTTYGTYDTTSNDVHGGSLRCNGNLRLYGMNVAFLNGTLGDDWEVAGDLTFDGYTDSTTPADLAKNPAALQIVDTTLGGTVTDATPSNAAAYSTVNGYIRDGSSQNDAGGFARNIQRLNPPAIDTPAPGAGGIEHYAALTNHGTQLSTTTGGPYIPETANGPATVYIDNTADEQPESSSAQVGSTLRDDWLNPAKNINGYWHGPFYDPPGATIVFGPQYITLNDGTIQPRWGFTITRSDAPVGLADQSHVAWRWNGESSQTSLTASTCTFVYGTAPTTFTYSATNPIFFIGADDVPQSQLPTTATTESVDNDIVIYAEGNIRVRGTVSPTGDATSGGQNDPDQVTDPIASTSGYTTTTLRASPHHVTLVTNQIAYVEGSLLKGGSFPKGQDTAPVTSENLSSIAVLARRYVTVNTTQFLAGAVQHSNLAQEQADTPPGDSGSTGALEFDADSSLTESFNEPAATAVTANRPANATNALPALFVSQYASGTGSDNATGLLRLVETAYDGNTYYNEFTLDGSVQELTGAASPTLAGSSSTPNRVVIPLGGISGNTDYSGSPGNGYDQLDLTFAKSPSSTLDYELSRAAVLPSDVKIEALLYAQDNSFFLIPGDWFNDDTTDTMTAYSAATPNARSRPATGNASNITGGLTDPQFPMYGQPIDMKITITGSVSENVPADISDQAVWMQHWGWIPKYHGSPPATTDDVASPHPQLPESALESSSTNLAPNALSANVAKYIPPTGLTFVYDPSETMPTTVNNNTNYNRFDQYGRPLPFTPNLPVSPDLLYSGQPTGNSLVQ